ncbi:unnamed protein product, partial [marine sediment metagenome]
MGTNREEAITQGELVYYAHILDPEFDEVDIVPISDAHYGNPLFSKQHFLRTLKFLERPNAFGFLNGDLTESTLKTSKGEIFRQVGSPEQQRDDISDMLYPYREKLLGADDGNHEDRIWREAGIHIMRDIAKNLAIPYRPEGLLHKISFGSGSSYHPEYPFVFWFYQTHGYGGARTKAAKAVKVERTATWIHADFYAMSHDHVVNVAPDVYLLPDPRTRLEKNSKGEETGFRVGRVRAHRKMLIKTNAYLKWGWGMLSLVDSPRQ